MGNYQCLHAHGVLFHEVGNAGVGVDHDLVGQPHLATFVVLFGMQELLAVGPVVIAQRHAHRRIGVHHLLGGNHLDLVRIGIQRVAFGDAADSRSYCRIRSKVHSEPVEMGCRFMLHTSAGHAPLEEFAEHRIDVRGTHQLLLGERIGKGFGDLVVFVPSAGVRAG